MPAPRSAGGTFIGDAHWTCLDAIVGSVLNGTSLIVITGEPGSGKSRILDAAVTRLAQESIRFVRLASAPLRALSEACLAHEMSFAEIVDCLPIGRMGQTPNAAWRGIKAPVRVCLVVDDADALGREGLRFLLQLVDATTGEDTAPTIIFIGRREFRLLHDQWALDGLHKRTVAHLLLSPLSEDGVGQYAEHLLGRAGTSVQHVMSKASMRALTRLAHGNPRRINSLVAIGLEFAAGDRKKVTTQHVTQAATILDARSEPLSIGVNASRAAPPRLNFEPSPGLAPQPVTMGVPAAQGSVQTRRGRSVPPPIASAVHCWLSITRGPRRRGCPLHP